MNWPKLLFISIVIGSFFLIFGDAIGDFFNVLDFTDFGDGVAFMGDIFGAFIDTFDTATALFPLTITTIVLIAGLNIGIWVIKELRS